MSSPYTLYYTPGAASFAVHWCLIELNASYSLKRVDLAAGDHLTPEYRALHPQGLVPVLSIDGEALTQSAALTMLLAERHPDGGLAPAVGQAGRDRWLEAMIDLANDLLPAMRDWLFPPKALPPAQQEIIRDYARDRAEAFWARLNQRLANQAAIVAEGFSTADIVATMAMRWSRNMPRPATAWPHLTSYAARMRSRPGFAQTCALEGLAEWTWAPPSQSGPPAARS